MRLFMLDTLIHIKTGISAKYARKDKPLLNIKFGCERKKSKIAKKIKTNLREVPIKLFLTPDQTEKQQHNEVQLKVVLPFLGFLPFADLS